MGKTRDSILKTIIERKIDLKKKWEEEVREKQDSKREKFRFVVNTQSIKTEEVADCSTDNSCTLKFRKKTIRVR